MNVLKVYGDDRDDAPPRTFARLNKVYKSDVSLCSLTLYVHLQTEYVILTPPEVEPCHKSAIEGGCFMLCTYCVVDLKLHVSGKPGHICARKRHD